jgi:lipoprotein-releasing system permease protein
LNIEYFIAKRILFDKESKKSVSKPVINIAVAGIALSLAVMLIAISVVTGFKREITNKVIGFGSHIQIINYDSNNSYETTSPLSTDQPFYPEIAENEVIEHIQVFATKPGIIKTKDEIQGVYLKGIGSDFQWNFFEQNLVEGNSFRVSDTATTNKVLISKFLASALKLNVGDRFAMYFIQDPPRVRPFEVAGIYQTNLEEFDRLYVLCDIKHIQKLNDWDEKQVSGFEIVINDLDRLNETTWLVRREIGNNFTDEGFTFRVLSIKEKYPQIFDWLNLQDMNVVVILILVICVAGINMISGLLVLILEKTTLIGTLKALGTSNNGIKKIFLYQSGYLILKGLFWGNVVGLSLAFLQKYFKIIKLDQTSYYLTHVPVNIDVISLLILNLATLITIILVLLLPAIVISRVNPVKAIRFN